MNQIDLLKQIDDLVASKTFNLEALEGIKKIKDDARKAMIEIEELEEKLKNAKAEIKSLADTNSTQALRIESLNKQVEAGKDAVEKGNVAIHEAAKQAAVANAWREAMQTVFKPNAVRENVWRNHAVVIPNGSGGGYTQTVQNQDQIVREDA